MKLSSLQIDALTEAVNIGVGRAASAMSDLTGTRIDLVVPVVSVVELQQLQPDPISLHERSTAVIYQDFQGEISGRAMLCFPQLSGVKLVQLLSGLNMEPDTLDLELRGVLTEVGNIVLSGVLGTLGSAIGSDFMYTVPQFSLNVSLRDMLLEMCRVDGGSHHALLADAHFRIAERDINGSVMVLFELGCLETVLASLAGAGAGASD